MYCLDKNYYTFFTKIFSKRLKVSEVLSLGDRDFLKEEYNNFTLSYKSKEYKQICIRVFTNNERFFWHLVSISIQKLDVEAKEALSKFENEILKPSLEEVKKRLAYKDSFYELENKIYLSILALLWLIDCLLDDEFVQITGGFDYENMKEKTVYQYGADIEKELCYT